MAKQVELCFLHCKKIEMNENANLILTENIQYWKFLLHDPLAF